MTMNSTKAAKSDEKAYQAPLILFVLFVVTLFFLRLKTALFRSGVCSHCVLSTESFFNIGSLRSTS
jgi:hypothetical protein